MTTTMNHAGNLGKLCTDDGTWCCSECGVSLVKCFECDGIGYHHEGCAEQEVEHVMTREMKALVALRDALLDVVYCYGVDTAEADAAREQVDAFDAARPDALLAWQIINGEAEAV